MILLAYYLNDLKSNQIPSIDVRKLKAVMETIIDRIHEMNQPLFMETNLEQANKEYLIDSPHSNPRTELASNTH